VQTLPISKVKDRLNELVEAASVTHEQVTITKNGSAAAVLFGAARAELCMKSTHHLDHSHVEGRFIAVTSTGGVLKAF
jgi:prevent-host-death family protein